MAERPNDALQTYKLSGQKSPRGKVGEQKKYSREKMHGKNCGNRYENRRKSPKIRGKMCGKLRGEIEKKSRKSRKTAGEIAKIAYLYISVIIDETSPKLLWQIVLMMLYKHTKFQVESRQGAGLVSKRSTNRAKVAKNREKNRQKSQKKKSQENREKKRKKNRKNCGENAKN